MLPAGDDGSSNHEQESCAQALTTWKIQVHGQTQPEPQPATRICVLLPGQEPCIKPTSRSLALSPDARTVAVSCYDSSSGSLSLLICSMDARAHLDACRAA